MRRIKQQLTDEETERILKTGTSGVLSVIDANGYPYTVPLSYVYANGAIYFHSAKTGHKIDAIGFCDKACFCVIHKDDVLPEKYTTAYKSVVAFGKVSVSDNADEIGSAMYALGNKYYPDHDETLRAEIAKSHGAFSVIKFEIEYVTGKQGKEFLV